MTNNIVTVCEACNTEASITHGADCLQDILGIGNCTCPSIELKELSIHGRKLTLCESCYAKEKALITANKNEDEQLVSQSVERSVIHEVKELHKDFNKWQDIYVTERKAWVIENFKSVDEMKSKLVDFIVAMETLEWEIKSKRRAAFDSAKELDARLSKEDRDRLINDPSFKPPTNKEFKKISVEREVDQTMKSLDLSGATKEQRKAAQGLMKLGMSIEDIKKTIKLKD